MTEMKIITNIQTEFNELDDTSSEHASSDNAPDATVYVKGAARKLWLLNNKEKLAMYARNQYHRRVEKDPEFRKVLVQRTLNRRKKLNAEKEPVEKPKKEPVEPPEKKLGGRPRKYI